MIKKEFRLRKRTEFAEMREKGSVKDSPLFGLVVIKNREKKKVGVIVSKKIAARAVDRNKIRRIVYTGARLNWEKWPEGTWGLFLIKKSIKEVKTEKIYEEISAQIAGLV